jgi:hypothetical protein
VSLVIVIVFILCHSLRWIPNIWELKQAGVKKVKHVLASHVPGKV